MCVNSIYITLINNNNNNSNSSSSLSSFIFYAEFSSTNQLSENCHYLTETKFAFCAQSDLDICRNCQRQGCHVIQCGKSTTDNSYVHIYIYIINYIDSNR